MNIYYCKSTCLKYEIGTEKYDPSDGTFLTDISILNLYNFLKKKKKCKY